METEKIISELESTGDYKVVKKLHTQESYNEDDGSNKRIAIFLDVETTGLSVEEAEIIELGMIAFEYSDDGRIFNIIDEFDEFDDGSIPVIHYQHKGEWYAKVGLTGLPQKLNMRGIQQHGRKWRVQKRTRGHLRKWTYDSLPEAQRKRDKLFG